MVVYYYNPEAQLMHETHEYMCRGFVQAYSVWFAIFTFAFIIYLSEAYININWSHRSSYVDFVDQKYYQPY